MLTIIIAILCLMKPSDTAVLDIRHFDKVYHGLAYFFLTFFWLLAFRKKSNNFPILLCCFFYGIIIEVLQSSLTTFRSGEYFDIVANTVGVLLAFAVFRLFLIKNILFKKNSL